MTSESEIGLEIIDECDDLSSAEDVLELLAQNGIHMDAETLIALGGVREWVWGRGMWPDGEMHWQTIAVEAWIERLDAARESRRSLLRHISDRAAAPI
jgi:hypothetical protein